MESLLKCAKQCVKNRFKGATCLILVMNGEEFAWSISLRRKSSKSLQSSSLEACYSQVSRHVLRARPSGFRQHWLTSSLTCKGWPPWLSCLYEVLVDCFCEGFLVACRLELVLHEWTTKLLFSWTSLWGSLGWPSWGPSLSWTFPCGPGEHECQVTDPAFHACWSLNLTLIGDFVCFERGLRILVTCQHGDYTLVLLLVCLLLLNLLKTSRTAGMWVRPSFSLHPVVQGQGFGPSLFG